MSKVFICSNCGKRLFEPPDSKDLSVEDVLRKTGRYCPNCGHELKFNSDKIRMYPV